MSDRCATLVGWTGAEPALTARGTARERQRQRGPWTHSVMRAVMLSKRGQISLSLTIVCACSCKEAAGIQEHTHLHKLSKTPALDITVNESIVTQCATTPPTATAQFSIVPLPLRCMLTPCCAAAEAMGAAAGLLPHRQTTRRLQQHPAAAAALLQGNHPGQAAAPHPPCP